MLNAPFNFVLLQLCTLQLCTLQPFSLQPSIMSTFNRCSECFLIHPDDKDTCIVCSSSVYSKSWKDKDITIFLCKCGKAYTELAKKECCSKDIEDIEKIKASEYTKSQKYVLQQFSTKVQKDIKTSFDLLDKYLSESDHILQGIKHADEMQICIDRCTRNVNATGNEELCKEFEAKLGSIREDISKWKILGLLYDKLDDKEIRDGVNLWIRSGLPEIKSTYSEPDVLLETE